MRMKILGSGQDEGIPGTHCHCEICNRARNRPEYRRLGPSVALWDESKTFCYMIDASPDFKYQLDLIHKEISETERKGKIPVSGIFLTHAHLGHCAGLWYLGKEALEERDLPVFCTAQMKQFLYNNYPFSLLVQRRNIKIEEIKANKKFKSNGLKCIPVRVPHRNEVADTVAYILKSKKRVLYLPDIDKWTESAIQMIESANIAFVDGTFYSEEEIPRFEEVQHPPIQETIEVLGGIDTEIYFTHINHTNPVNKEGKERKRVVSRGFKIACDGMMLEF